MSVRDLAKEEPNRKQKASYCIVGGGIAGLLLATRLARRNQQVVVLESGRLQFDPQVHALNEIEDATGRYTRALTGRYRGLGGSSTRWGGRIIPINPSDSKDRSHVGQPAWPIETEALSRYTAELEEMFGVGHDSFEELNPSVPDAAGAIGSGGDGLSARWAKCLSFKRRNMLATLGQQIEASPNITVWLDATASGFELDRHRGRLVGVKAHSLEGTASVTVEAQEFIFAAGTIETTRLLLLLDEASDNQAFRGTDALGCYFQDHLKAEIAKVDRQDPDLTNRLLSYRFVHGVRRDLHLELSPEAQREDAVASAFIYVASDWGATGMAALKDLAEGVQRRRFEARQVSAVLNDVTLLASSAYWRIRHQQLYVPPQIDIGLMSCVEQLPDPGNRIRLGASRDRLGMRKALVDWRPRPIDERGFQSTRSRLRRFWHRAGLDLVCPLRWKEPDTPVISRAEPCAHPSGTTRMGTNPATSVVGPDLRCHAIPNLAIASASVFPTAGSANPTFTIMQLAMWLSDSYRNHLEPIIQSAVSVV